MPKNIQVKNVPDEVHAVFVRRAKAAGQSLQEYLLEELRRGAQRPTIEELERGEQARWRELRGRGSPRRWLGAELIREERDGRS